MNRRASAGGYFGGKKLKFKKPTPFQQQGVAFMRIARSRRKYNSAKSEAMTQKDYRMPMEKTKYEDPEHVVGSIYENKSATIQRKKFDQKEYDIKSFYFHLIAD